MSEAFDTHGGSLLGNEVGSIKKYNSDDDNHGEDGFHNPWSKAKKKLVNKKEGSAGSDNLA